MLQRFPKSLEDNPHVKLCHSGKSLMAYFKLVENYDKQEGFLTEHTLVFVIEGMKCIHMADQAIEVRPGNLLLLKRGVYFMSDFLEETYQAVIVCLNDDFIKSFIDRYNLFSTTQRAPDYVPGVIRCSEQLLNIRNGILHYLQHPNSNTSRLLELKLEELLLLLITGSDRAKVVTYLQQLFDERANSIELVLKRYLFNPFTLDEYAKMCGMSLSTFKREFSKLYNTSPKEWINKERLMHADFMLTNTSKNVNEVAVECGFENVSYFIKVYKTQFGYTPKNARRSKIADF